MPFSVVSMNYDLKNKRMLVYISSEEDDGLGINIAFKIEDQPIRPGDSLEKQGERRALEILQRVVSVGFSSEFLK